MIKLAFTRTNGPVVELCIKLDDGPLLIRELSSDAALGLARGMIDNVMEAQRYAQALKPKK